MKPSGITAAKQVSTLQTRTLTMNRKLLSAALLLALAACGPQFDQDVDGLKAPRTTTTKAPTYGLKLTDARFDGLEPSFKTSFVINSTYEVLFATEIVGTLSGRHTQTLFVSMPGGSAYQRFDVAFVTDVAPALGEQQAEKTATGWRVWVSLPVAGTIIEQYALTGGWTAQVNVDGILKSTSSFNLQ
jgi:hypothetical protein